jgi:hypothetical protein
MDIASMSIALNQGKVQQQASLSVMKMAMGDVKQQGQGIQELLGTSNPTVNQHAAQPHLGGNIDIKG